MGFSYVIYISCVKDVMQIYHLTLALDHLYSCLKIIFNNVGIYGQKNAFASMVLGTVLKLEHMTGCMRFFMKY